MPISTSEPKDLTALRGDLAAQARDAGFDDIGIARADARPDLPERLRHWLDLGCHGGMGWMKETRTEGFYRSLRVLRIVEGTSEIQRMMIARAVLGEVARRG